MIIGIGIDAIEIERFAQWHTYEQQKLQTIFSDAELAYIRSKKDMSSESFAARFAVKEACFKAVSQYLDTVALRSFMPHCVVMQNEDEKPFIQIDWKQVIAHEHQALFSQTTVHVSITHTRTLAMAYVIIEKNAGN